jgi:hypothetical protein
MTRILAREHVQHSGGATFLASQWKISKLENWPYGRVIDEKRLAL